MKKQLTDILNIEFPIIMAPMFLVSNTDMIIAALKSGITAAVPALNYRTDIMFRTAIDNVRKETKKPFGVNLIVNKSNIKLDAQLKTCIDKKVDFIITSLGSPKDVIAKCKHIGIKVFCDVTDVKYAKKVEELGADAIIAVNKEAGGHSGNISYKKLIPLLNKECNIPVISAGGVGSKQQIDDVLKLGAAGVSVGSVFIASYESGVSDDYKNAIVKYGANDIVLTSKISGTPITVINTDYVQKIGTETSWFQNMLLKNKWLKKYAKILIALNGMNDIKKSAFKATYKTIWVAGISIENVKKIKSVKEIVESLTS
ncbi:MAG: nitronate monooxygenase [Ichthyobacteriaceae bacterium]|nr:nitronate monooxygenase [Ichthyobacteriaceae bacterium]